MPELDDIRTVDSITAADLADGDFHLVFDVSANVWKRILHSEGNKENKPVPGTPVKAVKAYVETALAGTNNDIRWTAVTAGVAGGLISVAYPVATAMATTTASASGVAVSVQAGTKARMTVSGSLTSDGSTAVVFPTLFFCGGLVAMWSSDGESEPPGSGVWYSMESDAAGGLPATSWSLTKYVNGNVTAAWDGYEDPQVSWPDLVSPWTPVSPATGAPTIAAAVSSAAQVIAAVAANSAAAALVIGTNKSGNDGTGAVATLTATLLSSGTVGVDGTLASAGDQFMDASYLYTALNDMTISTMTGWMTSPLTAL